MEKPKNTATHLLIASEDGFRNFLIEIEKGATPVLTQYKSKSDLLDIALPAIIWMARDEEVKSGTIRFDAIAGVSLIPYLKFAESHWAIAAIMMRRPVETDDGGLTIRMYENEEADGKRIWDAIVWGNDALMHFSNGWHMKRSRHADAHGYPDRIDVRFWQEPPREDDEARGEDANGVDGA